MGSQDGAPDQTKPRDTGVKRLVPRHFKAGPKAANVIANPAPGSAQAPEANAPGIPERDDGPRGPGPRPGLAPQIETLFPAGEAPAPSQSDPMEAFTPRTQPDNRQGSLDTYGPTAGPELALAVPAQLRRRHLGLMVFILMLVVLPLALTAFYLFAVAEDQYASTTAFTVRQEEGASASDLIGLDFLAGTGGASDTDILFEFIQSQEIVEKIDQRLDLRGHYAQHWNSDKVFSLWPSASTEELIWFWRRVVRISYDQAAGLIEIEVRAFDPVYAQALAREIVAESQDMINALSAAAQADATRYAQADLDQALERLKRAREALTAFRTSTQIVDPEADIQARMGVMNNLQQQLAEALIEFDLLSQTSTAGDPRLQQASRRIEVIRSRIAGERQAFAQGADDVGALTSDYPSLIAEFERLTVDNEYAEETYRAALTAFDVARANAIRRSRYLAAYIEPTLADEARYPQRYVLTALAALFLVLTWSILALVYYSIRDRR